MDIFNRLVNQCAEQDRALSNWCEFQEAKKSVLLRAVLKQAQMRRKGVFLLEVNIFDSFKSKQVVVEGAISPTTRRPSAAIEDLNATRSVRIVIGLTAAAPRCAILQVLLSPPCVEREQGTWPVSLLSFVSVGFAHRFKGYAL